MEYPAYVLEGGRILRMGGSMEDAEPGTALVGVPQATIVQIVDPRSEVVWEVRPGDLGIDRFHHDMVPMSNGNILILTYTMVTADEAAAMGWDLQGVAMALSDGIVEVRPNFEDGSAEVVWAWHFHDHIIQDRDPEAPNYGVVADHPERIDPHFPESYSPGDQIRQHLNGIDYNPGARSDRGQFLHLRRNLDRRSQHHARGSCRIDRGTKRTGRRPAVSLRQSGRIRHGDDR